MLHMFNKIKQYLKSCVRPDNTLPDTSHEHSLSEPVEAPVNNTAASPENTTVSYISAESVIADDIAVVPPLEYVTASLEDVCQSKESVTSFINDLKSKEQNGICLTLPLTTAVTHQEEFNLMTEGIKDITFQSVTLSSPDPGPIINDKTLESFLKETTPLRVKHIDMQSLCLGLDLDSLQCITRFIQTSDAETINICGLDTYEMPERTNALAEAIAFTNVTSIITNAGTIYPKDIESLYQISDETLRSAVLDQAQQAGRIVNEALTARGLPHLPDAVGAHIASHLNLNDICTSRQLNKNANEADADKVVGQGSKYMYTERERLKQTPAQNNDGPTR